MTLTVTNAHEWEIYLASASVSEDLGAPPADAVGIVVASLGDMSDGPKFGGVSLTQVLSNGTWRMYELLDLSGAANDLLTATVQWYEGMALHAAWLLAGSPVERLDDGNIGSGSLISLDPAGKPGTAAYVAGYVGSGGGTVPENIWPHGSQVELDEGTNGPGGGAVSFNASWLAWGATTTAQDVGVDRDAGTGWSGGMLYAETAVSAFLARHGEAAGFRGLTIEATGDGMVFLSRRPAEATGFRPLTIRASGPRQVALVGRHLGTSEMTEGGTDGQVLTYHAASKPTWEDSTGIGGDTSLLIDTSVSGAVDVDRADAATHDLTLTGDATLTPIHSTAVAGEAIDLRILIRQDGTGGWTLDWGGTISWAGGTEPTMPTDPDALLTVGLLSVDDAVTWLGYVADADAAGVPATTVTDETTWGITPAVGTDTEYARQDHTHGSPAEPASDGIGPILIADDHSVPLVFADLLQTEEGDDLLYFDGG